MVGIEDIAAPDFDPWFDRFGGKLVLVLLDNKRRTSVKGGRSLWALHDPLIYWAVRIGGQRGWGQADQIERRMKADVSDAVE